MYRFYSSPYGTSRVSVVGNHENGVLQVAVARCSEKDNFIRKKGRMIAEGRLRKGKIYRNVPLQSCDIQQFVEIAKEITLEVITTKKVIR